MVRIVVHLHLVGAVQARGLSRPAWVRQDHGGCGVVVLRSVALAVVEVEVWVGPSIALVGVVDVPSRGAVPRGLLDVQVHVAVALPPRQGHGQRRLRGGALDSVPQPSRPVGEGVAVGGQYDDVIVAPVQRDLHRELLGRGVQGGNELLAAHQDQGAGDIALPPGDGPGDGDLVGGGVPDAVAVGVYRGRAHRVGGAVGQLHLRERRASLELVLGHVVQALEGVVGREHLGAGVVEHVELQRVVGVEAGLEYLGEASAVVERYHLLGAPHRRPGVVGVVDIELPVCVPVREDGMAARSVGAVDVPGLEANQLRFPAYQHTVDYPQPHLLGGEVPLLRLRQRGVDAGDAGLDAGRQLDGGSVIPPLRDIALTVHLVEAGPVPRLLVRVVPLGVAGHAQAHPARLLVGAVVGYEPPVVLRPEPGVHGEAGVEVLEYRERELHGHELGEGGRLEGQGVGGEVLPVEPRGLQCLQHRIVLVEPDPPLVVPDHGGIVRQGDPHQAVEHLEGVPAWRSVRIYLDHLARYRRTLRQADHAGRVHGGVADVELYRLPGRCPWDHYPHPAEGRPLSCGDGPSRPGDRSRGHLGVRSGRQQLGDLDVVGGGVHRQGVVPPQVPGEER